MPSFSIKYPFFILMACLIIVVVGVTTVFRMPVDLFPEVNIPVVVVATFYSGMPPQQIESNITNSYERFFTLGSGIDHIESRSLPGVSLIKIFFQPGTDANAAVSNISNLAMANLRRLPPGTLPPVVLKFDAANLPVCLITLKGQGLNETQLKDLAQFTCSQPGGKCSWRFRATALWRPLSPDHGVCRSAQAGGTPDQCDGCGHGRQRIEPDSAGGRRSHWHERLQHLRQ